LDRFAAPASSAGQGTNVRPPGPCARESESTSPRYRATGRVGHARLPRTDARHRCARARCAARASAHGRAAWRNFPDHVVPVHALLLDEPPVQTAGQLNHELEDAWTMCEMRCEFTIDLQGAPEARVPLAEARRELMLLFRSHGEQGTVACRANLNLIVGAESEAVPAAHVVQPAAHELEFLGGRAQR